MSPAWEAGHAAGMMDGVGKTREQIADTLACAQAGLARYYAEYEARERALFEQQLKVSASEYAVAYRNGMLQAWLISQRETGSTHSQ